MKVRELIEQLQDMDPNAEVMFVYNYGDYWRTDVAASINEVVDGAVEYSAYHRMDKVVEDQCEPDEEASSEDRRDVVLIK